MEHELTAAAQRVFVEAARWTENTDCDELLAPALLLGLLSETECPAALLLAKHAVSPEAVCQNWPNLMRLKVQPGLPRLSNEVQASLAAVRRRWRDIPDPLVLSTEHLLLGLLLVEHATGLWLLAQGLDPKALEGDIHRRYGYSSVPLLLPEETAEPIPLEEEVCSPADGPTQAAFPADSSNRPPHSETGLDPEGLDSPPPRPPLAEGDARTSASPAQLVGVLRVLDAAWNRTREGLRVVEDYTRFVLDDRHLTNQLKELRHELTSAMATVPLHQRLAARETQADVGTRLSTEGERHRQDSSEVLTANFVRVQEGLRSLEEFSKILDPELAARLERFRYRTYTLHRAVEITRASLERLGGARLYVLLDGQSSVEAFMALVRALVGAGVDILQLRDKKLDDRQLLERARLLRELTEGTETLFVMNDRPDLAVLARADGVHVGQEELSVKDARAIVGPTRLVGVSTHSLAQARQAVLDGADYLGAGPTFPSGTKPFDHFPGLDFLRQVAAEIRLPAFAIGGIHRENLPQVLSTGLLRIAVSGAVTTAADPAAAARELLAMLEAVGRRP